MRPVMVLQASGLVLFWLCASTALHAQELRDRSEASWEIGMDFGFQLGQGEDDGLLIFFPTGLARVGVRMAPKVRLDVGAEFRYASVDNASGHRLTLLPALLYSFDDEPSGPYLLAAGGIERTGGDLGWVSASENRFGVGAGVGLRRFVTEVMALRFEGRFMYWAEGKFSGSAQAFQGTVGLSFFP